MTEHERAALIYLSPLMEATAGMVGRAIVSRWSGRPCNEDHPRVAATPLGRLRKQGLVTFLPDLRAWRITSAGRAAIAEKTEASNTRGKATPTPAQEKR